jgi:hypothetical protein
MAESHRCSAFCLKAFRRERSTILNSLAVQFAIGGGRQGRTDLQSHHKIKKNVPKERTNCLYFQILNTTEAVGGTLSRLTPYLVIDEAGGGIVG